MLITSLFIFLHLVDCKYIVSVSRGNLTRNTPLFGIGNELLFQQLNYTQLNGLIESTNSNIQRYPGGTPSDYWLWNIGWVNTTAFKTNLPELQALPIEWNKYLTTNKIDDTIIVLNQLTSNLSFQIEGLREHSKAGTSISYIELGNEMYDNTRSDVVAAYPNPYDYALKMANWSISIYNEFPNAKIALIGWGVSNISDNGYTSQREAIWNKQVLNNNSIEYSKGVTSVTIHLYYSINGKIDTADNVVKLLQRAFSNVRYDAEYWNKTIPYKYNLWVTEMGTFGNNALLYTWFEALFMGVLELYIPFNTNKIKMIVPYCLVCGDPNMPAFIYNNITKQYEITAIGILETMLVSEMRSSSKMTILDWNNNNNNNNNDYLIGWRLDYVNIQISKAIIININQYEYNTKLTENILEPNCDTNNMKMKSIYTDSLDILIKTHSTTNDLITNITNISNNFTIPPWSINIIYC